MLWEQAPPAPQQAGMRWCHSHLALTWPKIFPCDFSADAVKPCLHPAEQRWLQAEPFHASGNSEATKHPSNFSPMNSSTPCFLRPATCIQACGLQHLHSFNNKALPLCSSLWVQEKHVHKGFSPLLTHLTLKIQEPWHKPS